MARYGHFLGQCCHVGISPILRMSHVFSCKMFFLRKVCDFGDIGNVKGLDDIGDITCFWLL